MSSISHVENICDEEMTSTGGDTASCSKTPSCSSGFQILPPELKALIVSKVREIDDNDDVSGSEEYEGERLSDGVTSHGIYAIDELLHSTYTADQPSSRDPDEKSDYEDEPWNVISRAREINGRSNMRSVSLLNRQCAVLAFPHLWQMVDLSNRSPEQLVEFYTTILPRHREHIKAIVLAGINLPENERDWERRKSDQVSRWARSKRNEVGPDPYLCWEYILISDVLRQLPNLIAVDMDFYPHLLWDEDLPQPDQNYSDWQKIIIGMGSQIEMITLDTTIDEPTTLLTEKDLATFLRRFPNLLSMKLYLYHLDSTGRNMLLSVMPSLLKLEVMLIRSGEYLNDTMARQSWCCPLRVLTLSDCWSITFEGVLDFLRHFRNTLEVLSLDGLPGCTVDTILGEATIDLPILKELVLSVDLPTSFLRMFDKCQLVEITWGCCPNIPYQGFEDFVMFHRNTLKRLIIEEESTTLSTGQIEAIELMCFTKHISFLVISGESDLSSSNGYDWDALAEAEEWDSEGSDDDELYDQ